MQKIKADLHNHFTTKSRVLDPSLVADTVYQKLGEGGICTLVNYSDRRFEAFANRSEIYATNLGNAVYFPNREVLILKGEEIPTGDGDLLVLGLEQDEHLSQNKGLEYHLKEAHEKGGITILTSPFFMSKVGELINKNPNLANYVDAVEIHNGEATRKANRLAYELCHGLRYNHGINDVGALSCSDGHSYEEVGTSYTEFTTQVNISLLDSAQITTHLRNMIRNAPRTHLQTYSTLGMIKHGAAMVGIMAASKLGVPLSRGDKGALR